MKKIFTATLMLGLATPLAAQTSFSDVIGKRLTNDRGYFIIKRNGRLDGEIDGLKSAMTWEAKDGRFCRGGKIGDIEVPYKCQGLRIKGDQISFINPDGSVSSTYKIE